MATSLSAFRLTNGQPFEQVRSVDIVDQLLLPHTVRWERVHTISQAFDAIKSMKIRGAPAIASLAALGIAAELLELLNGTATPSFSLSSLSSASELRALILTQTAHLLTSRPTAVNLLEGLTRIEAAAKEEGTARQVAEKTVKVAVKVWTDDRERNVTMGDHGANWILEKLEREGTIEKGEKITVLTVCNTGSLATSGYGTAIGVITSLHKYGRLEHAYFAQTGPYQQGARLTSMELAALKIENTMVCDTAIGALIAEKRIHLFVAGADRIAANGDTANKISTYQISLLCSSPHPFSPNPAIPVLIAAPIATLDLAMDSGRSIVIEQRPSWEACTVRGRVVDIEEMARTQGVLDAVREGEDVDPRTEEERVEEDAGTFHPDLRPKKGEVDVRTVLVTPPNTRAFNPAFDVTPASLIAGIVTELGVAKKSGNEFDLRAFVGGAPSK